jgi:hypothetical protein
LRLWDFCCKWVCSIKACTASNAFSTEGRTPWEVVLGRTPDISSLAEYDFYEPVWYYDAEDFPEPRRHLGRWLGEATHIGQAMCYYILPISGVPIARSSVQPVTDAEKNTEEVQQELKMLDQAIYKKFGSPETQGNGMPDYFNLDMITDNMAANDDPFTPQFEPMEDGVPDACDPDILDQYLSAQVQLPLGDELVLGKVVARKRDAHGNPIG